MRTRCTAALPFLLVLLLQLTGCSSHRDSGDELYNEGGLSLNVIYLCGQMDGKPTRTKMQVRYQSSSDEPIALTTVQEIGEIRGEPVSRTIDPRVTGNLEQVEVDPANVDITVHIYRGDEEIATAVFAADDHACRDGDGKG